MFLHSSPLSAANSPTSFKSKKTLQAAGAENKAQIGSTHGEELFDFHAVAFLYLKREKQWKELGEGKTTFSFDKEASAITVRRGDNVHHKVSLSTKVQSQVGTSQSWVFRAVHCVTGSHDVLCLQLPENASGFVSCYEANRTRCLQSVENGRELASSPTPNLLRSHSSTSTTSSKSDEISCGADLNTGCRRSIALKSTTSKIPQASPTPEQTAAMRRRLSTVGSEFSIDGYAPGARNELRAYHSPTQKSPLRSSVSGSAKTLRPYRALPTQLTFSGVSVKGVAPYNPDKQNQDAVILHQLPTGEVLLSVFDGHGEEGKIVSNHFRDRIPKYLANSPLFASQETTGMALKETLVRGEREIVDNVRVDTTLSGTTAVVAVIRGQKLFVANVGDSRAIFGMQDLHSDSKAYIAKDITIDHKPDLPSEQKRIQEVGGRVFAVKFDDGIDGPARVWLSYADLPGLAMSRSLCDTIAKEAGVVSDPEIFEVDITAEHKFMVIASDGLWEFMSSQEVVDIVAKYAADPDPEAAIEELVEESARRWRMNEPVIDDTSIIVAFFV